MAGSRGATDPVALADGKSHKCLVEISGETMLVRVIKALAATHFVEGIVLCIEPGFEPDAATAETIAEHQVSRLDAASSPARSALRALESLPDRRILIVTGDAPLLNREILDAFCGGVRSTTDVAVGVARSEMVLGQYPHAVRTLLRFSDGPFCGCNLYALDTARAAPLVRFWVRVEANRKKPWRMVFMLGPLSLLRYVGGRLNLGDALDRLSARLDVRLQAVEIPLARAAIDVDKPEDLALVTTILDTRDPTPPV